MGGIARKGSAAARRRDVDGVRESDQPPRFGSDGTGANAVGRRAPTAHHVRRAIKYNNLDDSVQAKTSELVAESL